MDKEYTPAEAKAWLAGYDAGKAFAKKEWVGLTDMEVMDICNFCSMQNGWFFVKEVEAKLKEKNT